jgi:mRNA interferase RelE/StbE
MMAPYAVKLSPPAYRQLKALPFKNQKLCLRLIEALAINPRPPGIKKIEGMMGLYLYYEETSLLRLIYKVEERELLVLLIK